MNPPNPIDIERLWNQPLAEAEFRRRLALATAELEGDELENLRSLVRWFQRRYPTALDRIRYARGKARGKFMLGAGR